MNSNNDIRNHETTELRSCGGSEMTRRWLGDGSKMQGCRHTLSILNEYGWSKARVWLEAAWSKARVCLEYVSGVKYALRLVAVLLVMMMG